MIEPTDEMVQLAISKLFGSGEIGPCSLGDINAAMRDTLTAVLAIVERDQAQATEYTLDRDRRPTPTPLTIGMRHIDIELTKLAVLERTEIVMAAIDHWLDRRNTLRGGEGGSR